MMQKPAVMGAKQAMRMGKTVQTSRVRESACGPTPARMVMTSVAMPKQAAKVQPQMAMAR